MVIETLPFSPWSSPPLELPTIAGLEVAATATDIYSNLRTALSSFPGRSQGRPPSFPTPTLGCTSPSPIPIPPHIFPQSKDNMVWVPSPSPLLTLPLTLLLQCQHHRPLSPQPSSIHSNIVINTIPDSEVLTLVGQITSLAMVCHVRKQCRALLKYMEVQKHITGALSAWTEDLLPAINILGNTELDNQVFTTTFCDYTAVEHLFLIPQILEKIEGYMLDDDVQSDKPIKFAEYNPTISLSSTPSPIPNVPQLTEQLNDPNHPGVRWSEYNHGDTWQYPLVFLNKYGQDKIAWYVTFRQIGIDTHIVGVRKWGDPEYSIPLHTWAHPAPNFNRPGVKDYDLNIFHPSSTSWLLIDNAIIDLKDPGVVADVYRYWAHQSELEVVKCQQVELDRRESNAQSKLNMVEWHLTHATVHTWLTPHLNCIHPASTNTIHIPCIFAAQELPNVEEGKDSLECCTVLGKWCWGGKPKFPYCLKCNESHLNHVEEECPLWKTCCWCLST